MKHFDGHTRQVFPIDERHHFRSGVILVSRTDERGVITHVNRAFADVSSYSREELIGSPHCIVRHPDMPKEIFEEMWKAISSGEEWHGYIKNLRKDGKYYWVYATIAPLTRNGEIIGFTSVRRTIDDDTIARCEKAYAGMRRRDRGESLSGDERVIANMPPTHPEAVCKELHYYNHEKRTVYITGERYEVPDGLQIITCTDLDGVITYANQGFIDVSGYSKDELIGMPHCIMRHPDMPARVYKDLWQTISQGREWHGYIKNLRKDGKYYWVYSTIEPLFNRKRISGYISTRYTIGEEKSANYEGRYREMRAQERQTH